MTTVFLVDMADFALMNEVYAEFFGDHRPARSTVGLSGCCGVISATLPIRAQASAQTRQSSSACRASARRRLSAWPSIYWTRIAKQGAASRRRSRWTGAG